MPVESLLTVGDAALTTRVHRLFTNARWSGGRACCAGAEVAPTVATVGCRYSHSLRLNTMKRIVAITTMISTEAMTPAVVPNPGYGTF